MKRTGRPSRCTEKMIKAICARLSEGESLRSICRDENMPGMSTVMEWRRSNPEFQEQYAHAREAMAQNLFDEILEISDDASRDTLTEHDRSGRLIDVPNSEWIARSRLRVDSRKWYLSKVLPKVYGEKLELSGDAESPITVIVQKLSGDSE